VIGLMQVDFDSLFIWLRTEKEIEVLATELHSNKAGCLGYYPVGIGKVAE
jgi:hypothetical protein